MIESTRVIHTECPGCKTHFTVSERLVGKMATCSACGSVFTVRPLSGGAAAGDVIDVQAEVISDSTDESLSHDASEEPVDAEPSVETGVDQRLENSGQRPHGWAGFDPARYPGNASRVRTFYFEKRFGQGPNCCSFGCFGMALVIGLLVYFILNALFG